MSGDEATKTVTIRDLVGKLLTITHEGERDHRSFKLRVKAHIIAAYMPINEAVPTNEIEIHLGDICDYEYEEKPIE